MRDPVPPNKVVEPEEQHLKLTSVLLRQIHTYAHALEHIYVFPHIHEHIHTHTLHQTISQRDTNSLLCVCWPSVIMYIASSFFIIWQTASHLNGSHSHPCPERLRLSFQYLCCYSCVVRVEESFANSCAIHWLLHRSFLLWKIIFKIHYIRLCCVILV